jgi:uncharacterized protein YjbI with pentapeptide repeats
MDRVRREATLGLAAAAYTLAIPIVLAVAGYLVASQQEERQRHLEEQRAQDTELQAYIDQMSQLLLQKDLRDPEAAGARTLVRARSAMALERLDLRRRTAVLRFLSEANLLQGLADDSPRISLVDTFERGVGGANLDLRGADLSYASLSAADLSGADLNGADLSSADLDGALLDDADLSDADLDGAFLNFTDLSDTKGINGEELVLEAASFAGTNLPGASYEPGRYNTFAFEPPLSLPVGGSRWRLSYPEVAGG